MPPAAGVRWRHRCAGGNDRAVGAAGLGGTQLGASGHGFCRQAHAASHSLARTHCCEHHWPAHLFPYSCCRCTCLPLQISKKWTHYGATLLFFFFGVRMLYEALTNAHAGESELDEVEKELQVDKVQLQPLPCPHSAAAPCSCRFLWSPAFDD